MSFISIIRNKFHLWRKKIPYRRTVRFIHRKPYTAFFITLGILLALIIISNLLNKLGQKPVVQPTIVKSVAIYKIGSAPKVNLQGQIQKSGVVKVNALAGGIVQTINVNEGDTVSRGTQLLALSSNYQGGDASGIQAAIAAKQAQLANDTYQEQKNLIATQRDLANNTQANNDQLRNLTSQSATEAASLINQNQDILNTLTDQLNNLENNQANGTPLPNGSTQTYDQLILQAKQLVSQYQGTINQLNTQQRQLAYQADTNQPFTQIQLNQRDISLKQLDIQEKTLDVNREVSNLQAALAAVNASLMYPASPCEGVVDRIYVSFGQNITPGTNLFSISCTNQSVKVVVQAPVNIATAVSRIEPSIIHLDSQIVKEIPDYISENATDGQLYTLVYHLPTGIQATTTDGNYIQLDVPVGLPNTGAADPFIPLDAVYQTQSSAYIFKIVNGRAKSQTITPGDVYGSYISVNSGLQNGDQIILNRDIVDGERVKANY